MRRRTERQAASELNDDLEGFQDEAMKRMRSISGLVVLAAVVDGGCMHKEPQYGREQKLFLPGTRAQGGAVEYAPRLGGGYHNAAWLR